MIESSRLPMDRICTHQLPLADFQKGWKWSPAARDRSRSRSSRDHKQCLRAGFCVLITKEVADKVNNLVSTTGWIHGIS